MAKIMFSADYDTNLWIKYYWIVINRFRLWTEWTLCNISLYIVTQLFDLHVRNILCYILTMLVCWNYMYTNLTLVKNL